MRPWSATIAVIVIGGLSGFSGAVLAGRLSSPPPPPNAREAPQSLQKPRQDRSDDSCERPREAPRLVPSALGSGAAPTNDIPAPSRISREEQGVMERDLQSKRMAAHLQEPRDTNWASPMETSLRESFERLRESSTISYANLECRYLSCKANLAWPDLKAARAGLELVGSLQDGLPCARLVVLDDMPPDGKVTGSVIFDCEHARLGVPDSLAQVERK